MCLLARAAKSTPGVVRSSSDRHQNHVSPDSTEHHNAQTNLNFSCDFLLRVTSEESSRHSNLKLSSASHHDIQKQQGTLPIPGCSFENVSRKEPQSIAKPSRNRVAPDDSHTKTGALRSCFWTLHFLAPSGQFGLEGGSSKPTQAQIKATMPLMNVSEQRDIAKQTHHNRFIVVFFFTSDSFHGIPRKLQKSMLEHVAPHEIPAQDRNQENFP